MKTGHVRQAAPVDDPCASETGGAPARRATGARAGAAGGGWIVAVLDDLVQLSGSVGLADTAQALRQARLRAEVELSRDPASAPPR